VRAVLDEHAGAIGFGFEETELVAPADMIPARVQNFTGAKHDGIAVMALIKGDLLDLLRRAVEHVQNDRYFTLIFIQMPVARLARLCWIRRLLLAIRRKNDVPVWQVGRVDIVTAAGRGIIGNQTREHTARDVIFPDIPGARATGIRGNRGVATTTHGEKQPGSIVRHLGIRHVAGPGAVGVVGITVRNVGRYRTWRRELTDIEIAVTVVEQPVGWIASDIDCTLDVGNREIAFHEHRVRGTRSTPAAGAEADNGYAENEKPTQSPSRP
jgi:hypothetical protein